MKESDIILFDGVCNLCNSAVLFIIKRDKKDRYRFAALQNDIGGKLLAHHRIDPDKTDSIVLIRDGKAYTKAGAALRIARYLSGGWPLLSALLILPKFLTNTVYDYIAHHRYQWFGKKEQCMIPTPELKAKFLDA
ncbi:thiol-disulfide oxidoreductase DCC family protein [Nonlabens xiamenensis]|uniref:thiol-disulfide oxidoreductase DCC family protein n=1 Tax=Nonlabens xiamenensis TaxID=2341043 RepID=UPI000F61159D|nr:thiol-disulfide oxidoreductase DCC family protein [Nonlabens xiamenensis]